MAPEIVSLSALWLSTMAFAQAAFTSSVRKSLPSLFASEVIFTSVIFPSFTLASTWMMLKSVSFSDR